MDDPYLDAIHALQREMNAANEKLTDIQTFIWGMIFVIVVSGGMKWMGWS